MSVLSVEDLKFWDENGYVIVHNAVPPENVKAVADAIWDFLEMQPDNPDSWYPDPPRKGIMAEMYQHQALWDNRQYPRVHQAFAEIWGTEQLWVSFDRASMSPPERLSPVEPLTLHWDDCLEPPIPLCVQGVLYLTDTTVDMGAFTCVPGFHRKIEKWLGALPPDADPRKQDLMGLGAKGIPGKAGDLIIWHSSLPHGAGQNTAKDPRVAQYITMYPAKETDEETRNHRIKGWKERLAGGGGHSIKMRELRYEKEHDHGQTAKLTPLGRKLLGLDQWR